MKEAKSKKRKKGRDQKNVGFETRISRQTPEVAQGLDDSNGRNHGNKKYSSMH